LAMWVVVILLSVRTTKTRLLLDGHVDETGCQMGSLLTSPFVFLMPVIASFSI